MQNTSVIIELSLAPVFLLVAIGQMLNVVTARLARVIDRARLLSGGLNAEPSQRRAEGIRRELRALGKRMRFANLATYFLSAAAVCVCAVVTMLFVDSLWAARNLEWLVVSLFVVTMVLITGGLVTFLGEISVATATVKVDPDATNQTNRPS